MTVTSPIIIQDGNIIDQIRYKSPETVYYEVIRVKNRALLFLELHLSRLAHSLSLAGVDYELDSMAIKNDLQVLFGAQGVKDQNVRLEIFCLDQAWHRVLYYAPSKYPEKEVYLHGVQTKTVHFTRHQPEIKQTTQAMTKIRQALTHDQCEEYILYNDAMEMLEGTKTNVYFVKEGRVFTAPIQEVLGGITRHMVNEILTDMDLLVEKALPVASVTKIEAAFLTGTSIGVLPVSHIDGVPIHSAQHPLVQKIQHAFETCLEDYIGTHQLSDH